MPFKLNLQKPHLLYFWTADPGPASIAKQPESQNHKLKLLTAAEMGVLFFCFVSFCFSVSAAEVFVNSR